MQVISKYNKRFRYLLFVISISCKYAWVVPLKDKNDIVFTNAFQKFLDQSARKSNKKPMDKGSVFTINQLKHGYKIMIQKCIQYIIKENLLLLEDSLQQERIKFINT